MTCKCHPQSPFLWYKNPRPSLMLQSLMYQNSPPRKVTVVKSDAERTKRITDVKTFTVYSRA